MRISLTTCVAIFILGWFGGSLFVLIFFGLSNLGEVYNTPKANLLKNHNLLRTAVEGNYFFKHHETPVPLSKSHRLPEFGSKDLSSEFDDETTWIFLDWPVDDRLFTIENYKALESILTVYPKSSLRCRVAASSDLYTHKIGNSLSYTQFSKYAKRQYDIEVLAVNVRQKSIVSDIAVPYRNKWLNSCCGSCNSTCRVSDHVQPYHLLTFIRLSSLYVKGGIFTDFSFLFLGPLSAPLVTQGYYINSYCGNKNKLENWQQQSDPYKSNSIHAMAPSSNCVSSTLLVFHTPRSEAILCVLRKYEEDVFVQCVESDGLYSGAQCVLSALDECFRKHRLTNDLAPRTAAAEGSLGFVSSEAVGNVLETFDNNPFRAGNTLLSSNWSIDGSARAVWMGSLAWGGSWHNYPYRNGSMMQEIVSKIKLNSVPSTGPQCLPRTKCHKFSKYLNIPQISANGSAATNNSMTHNRLAAHSRLVAMTHNTGIEELSCAPSVVIAGFQKSASSFLFNALAAHPLILPSIRGFQHKEPHCYSYDPRRPDKLLNRAWCYPFVEAPAAITAGEWDLPTGESTAGEPFLSLDGSMRYSSDHQVPYTLRADNPQVKVIFVVRNPIWRLYSAYRTSFSSFNRADLFDDFVEQAMHFHQSYSALRRMTTNGTDMTSAIAVYYNQDTATVPGSSFRALAASALFQQSVYYPAVLHFSRVLGRHNVKVVSSEDLSVDNSTRLQETLSEIFRFIGVCPVESSLDAIPPSMMMRADKIGDGGSSGSSGSGSDTAASFQMSQDMYLKLQRFFAPFNNQLMNISADLNVSHWNSEPPLDSLPRFSPGLNTSRPPLWFENKMDEEYRGNLVPHLLPQRTSKEDSGYNTTLGMLNSF